MIEEKLQEMKERTKMEYKHKYSTYWNLYY